MKFHCILPVAFLIVLGASAAALANGAVSEFPAGGVVVIKPEKNISIIREDLEIGWDRIRVRYVFESTAHEPIERTIGFPMAKVPLDDSPDNLENRSWSEDQEDHRNYMAFEVAVDGKPLEPKLHEYAWLGDLNVTGRLRKMGIPLYAASAEAHAKLAQLPEETLLWLRFFDLVETDGDWVVPQWQYQTVYEWTQTFGSDKTVVEISYRPLFGSFYGPEPYYEDGPKSSDYCYDSATKQTLARVAKERGLPTPFTVGYILTTAENWTGPIGEFHLTISKEEGDIVRFCVPEGLSAVGDGVSWTAEQFVPRSDLNIVFFPGR